MKTKSVIKRLTIYTSLIPLLFILKSSSIKKRDKSFFINTTKITKNKIEYNSGTIYIGNQTYLNRIKNLNDDEILVLDARREVDPDIKIYDSYKINDDDIMEEIIESLLLYEEKYPTKWDRSKNSMFREWIVHNIMYELKYKVDDSMHVDLNNKDEKKYRIRNR